MSCDSAFASHHLVSVQCHCSCPSVQTEKCARYFVTTLSLRFLTTPAGGSLHRIQAKNGKRIDVCPVPQSFVRDRLVRPGTKPLPLPSRALNVSRAHWAPRCVAQRWGLTINVGFCATLDENLNPSGSGVSPKNDSRTALSQLSRGLSLVTTCFVRTCLLNWGSHPFHWSWIGSFVP